MSVFEALAAAAGMTAALCLVVVLILAWVDFVAKLNVSERASIAIGLLPLLIAFTASITSLLYQSGVL